jgi:beta-1,2-mannobiose phosphorylase / 1,2-beta-oligomannan phosphorylase
MKWPRPLATLFVVLAALSTLPVFAANSFGSRTGTKTGWRKYRHNPVLGGNLGTCFDVSVLRQGGKYKMWFSWRPKKSIALVESRDGIHWGKPVIALAPNLKSGWEADINRPVVIRHADSYDMWYTGQARGHSWIGYATSQDGIHWRRMSRKPVLSPEEPWEKAAVMCPDVIWDETTEKFRMWYSGGDNYEPNAIGYATSADGIHWTKGPRNPVFQADANDKWERQRVTGCQVIHVAGWYYMFYIGFRDVNHAQIGLARSRDGMDNWQRLPGNPIVGTGTRKDDWDHDACYKPYAVWDGKQWLLWYNGRNGHLEQIGLAIHPGNDLGFPN